MVRPADNPFRTACIDALPYRMPHEDWTTLCQRLADSNYRGAIIGPHGAGKSTLLRRISEHLESQGIPNVPCFLNRESRRHASEHIATALRACGPDSVLCLDGAEQLGRLRWRHLLWQSRPIRGFLITAHHAGRLPTLHQCGITPDLVDLLLKDLLPGHDGATRDAAHAAWRLREGNMRAVLFDLYDRHAAH